MPVSLMLCVLHLAMYADASASVVRMRELAEEVERKLSGVKAIVPKLKGMERASVKTHEKYKGKYCQLTDLARMTFNCPTAELALAVLRLLHADVRWTLVRVKDRLVPFYDAHATGGYRDMLVNARDNKNNHIVEMQVRVFHSPINHP